MKKNQFSEKLKELFVGKQSPRKRFVTSFFPSLILSFILFLYGPLDLSFAARDELDYTILDILPTCLKVWGIIFAVLFFLSWIPGGKLHAWIASLYAGLAAAFYLQGNYLNPDLGLLNGETIQWQNYGDNALINLGIFVGILLVPFLIHFFSRKIWKSCIVFVSVLLFIMQIIPLGAKIIQANKSRVRTDEHYIVSKENEFVLGEENIVVFLLDYTSPRKLASMLKIFPDTLEPFHDFTYYDNYNTDYVGTYPATSYLLTHYPYDKTMSKSEWLYQAWHSEDALSFYSQLQDAGWHSRIFNEVAYSVGDPEYEYGLVSSVKKVDGPQQFSISSNIFRKLMKLSFFRYFPLIMKAPFWIYTSELNNMKVLPEEEKNWDAIESVLKYWDQGLSRGDEEKVYVSYHWVGAHEPIYLDETGRILKNSNGITDMEAQLAGHFHLISEYIQQMKDYHIYDNSTIIITTDHGDYAYPHSIFFIKPKNQRQEEMTVNHAPISHSDFMATIAELAGLEKGQFGRSFFEIPEDEERYRCSLVSGHEYCYYGNGDTLYRMVRDGDYIE